MKEKGSVTKFDGCLMTDIDQTECQACPMASSLQSEVLIALNKSVKIYYM
jgi:hypothetical protein